MSKHQAEAFLNGMGDEYYARNINDLGKQDPIDELLTTHQIKPKAVLEIGCANGWRLRKLFDRYGCQVRGVEPSKLAVDSGNLMLGGKFNWIVQGVAEELPFARPDFDLVIFGFSLWLCDPRHWFQIAANADRVLKDGGYLIVHDFIPPRAFRYQYAPDHASKAERELWAWIGDHAKLWAAHPGYTEVAESYQFKRLGEQCMTVLEGVTLLRKDIEAAFPAIVQENRR